MNEGLRAGAIEYLALRCAMGYKTGDHEWLLREFLGYLDGQHASVILVSHAVTWACLPQDASSKWRNHRLSVIRSFAAHVHTSNPDGAELIPAGLLPARLVRAVPYLYSPAHIITLMGAANSLTPAVRGLTLATIIGLMTATGMRIGEVVALNTTSIDAERVTVLVRGKGGTQRLLPVHVTTLAAVRSYLKTSRALVGTPPDDALFVNVKATRPLANNIQTLFRAIATECQLPPGPGIRKPRLHDLRHTFAVNTLIDAHRNGVAVEARIAALSTYLGHVSPADTYWYLTASPELLQLVNDRVLNHHYGELS